MLRFPCILLMIAVIYGCTNNQHSKTFKERYNAYADPQLDYEEVKKRRYPKDACRPRVLQIPTFFSSR